MKIRKAIEDDIPAIAEIYSDTHTAEENGSLTTGWIRGVYPTRATAEAALMRGDLFVMEADGAVVGAAIINQTQVEEYKYGHWRYDVPDDEVMVLHTLVISPKAYGRGYGRAFVSYYEDYALERGCKYLRIDTNERNTNARRMYKKLGFWELDTVRCDFNGLKDVGLLMLEKKLD